MLEQLNNPWTITIIGGMVVFIFGFLFKKFFQKKDNNPKKRKNIYGWRSNTTSVKDDNTIINNDTQDGDNNINININERNGSKEKNNNQTSIDELKRIINILFVDDDISFNITKILKRQGWINTKIKTDIIDLDKFSHVHIFFVDINGVGKKLNLKNEGMDLALCLKNKFEDKKVVLYSTDTNRDISHPIFNKIDAILPKDAQVYQFTDLIEQFSREINI
ncbi:hypothetical protein KAI65_04580 [Candidatus Parcubacteria bacterium]|nr:hypothetical protein [Candidatus Parcubacteria bacterium]